MSRSKAKVVVIGGGPAGIATALFATHAAPDLCDGLVVLERGRYPREKYCAGAVGARGDKLLGTIGVTVDVPSVAIEGIAFRAMGSTLVVREPAAGRVVRRLEFDARLAAAAQERGVEVRQGVTVRRVVPRADGVDVETDAGSLRADIVVGADGVRSVVRRSLALPSTGFHAQALEVDTEPVASDLDRDVILFDASRRDLPGYYWDFPTVVGGRPMVCRGVYYLKEGAGRAPPVEIRRVLEEELSVRGLDLATLEQKRYAERGFHRHAPIACPRILLAGEAAGIDPVTGEGIAQALQYGAVAGAYVARKIQGGDLEFADWPARVRATMIGRDLLVRSAALGLFYGSRRSRVERFLLENPDFIRVGMQHFAGKRWDRRAVVSGGAAALVAALRAVAEPLFSFPARAGSVRP